MFKIIESEGEHMSNHTVWTQKYEPKTLDEMVLNPAIRRKLENVLSDPKNLILHGSTGLGKGTFVRIFLNETAANAMEINASDETGIEVVREKVKFFVLTGNVHRFFEEKNEDIRNKHEKYNYLKFMILNESENLSKQAQASLRDLVETQERFCKFIFMTNDINKIDPALKSRCAVIEIKDPPKDDIEKHMENILSKEGIKFERGILCSYIQKYYPDMRKIVKEVQISCQNNELVFENKVQKNDSLNKDIMDLKLHMTFFNIDRKRMYEKLNKEFGLPISQQQFYQIMKNCDTNTVSMPKKSEFINLVHKHLPLDKWHNEYLGIRG